MTANRIVPSRPEADAGYVFARAPMLVYWEMTRACDLACRHCRAEAVAHRNPGELSEAAGQKMLEQSLGFGEPLPHFVFTGGDPFKRPDLFRLIETARHMGFGVSLAPSGTPLVTREKIERLATIGLAGMSLSFDGATAASHDAFRGVPGCFDTTVQVADWIRDSALPLQVNTLVTAETLAELPAIADLITRVGAMRWSLFFLISVGRGRTGLTEITPAQSERLFAWLYRLSQHAPYQIKTTEAMHYRRVAVKHMRAEHMSQEEIRRTSVGRGFGIRDGNGIMFVSHTGDVYPSGFLPVRAGNVEAENIVDLYRESPVFVRIRDVSLFEGKCGWCSFADVCGGSRARAYAATGNYLAVDPLCAYQPRATPAGAASKLLVPGSV